MEKIEKGREDFNTLAMVEKLRKKLSTDERPYHSVVKVKSGFVYVTNGYYMAKFALEDEPAIGSKVQDGIYRILKNKTDIILEDIDFEYPMTESIEADCKNYQEPVPFTYYSRSPELNPSYVYCQIIRTLKTEILNFDMFKEIYSTGKFNCFKLCEDEGKAVILADCDVNALNMAWIMPCRGV